MEFIIYKKLFTIIKGFGVLGSGPVFRRRGGLAQLVSPAAHYSPVARETGYPAVQEKEAYLVLVREINAERWRGSRPELEILGLINSVHI